MHDPQHWREEASRKLANSKLSASEREEISRELAGYLDDLCADALARGFDVAAAAQHSFAELHEDTKLGAHLYSARKENAMHINERTKRFWLPGVTMFVTSAALLAAFQFLALGLYHAFAPAPITGSLSIHAKTYPELVRQVMWHNGAALIIYFGWLCTLPFLGALGAHWSRRAGSSRSAQIATGLFPLILFFAIFIGQFNVGGRGTSLRFLAMDALPPAHIFFVFLPVSLNLLLNWLVIPGVALLAGVLPFVYANAKDYRGAAFEAQPAE